MTIFGGFPGDSSSARRHASEAASDATSAKRDVSDMRREIGRLRLGCAAVWELVKERTNLSENDLIAKVAELDAKDGTADGQLSRAARKCAQCQRTLPAKQYKCMYCGADQPVTSVFEGI